VRKEAASVPAPARVAGVGAFVVAGLLLFTIGLFMIGDRQMAFSRKFTIYTEFAKITGLQPGSVIRVSGAKAGAIKQILTPGKPSDRFRVQLEITEALHGLVRTDSVATIETEGLVGGSYLGVGTGTDGAPPAPPSSTIPSKEPFEIADLMEQMRGTIQRVNDTIDEMKYDVQRAVVSVADTAGSANDLVVAVSDDVKRMAAAGARISADAAQIADSIRGGKGTVGKLVNDDELYRRSAAIAKQVDEIATGARQVIEQAKSTLEGFESKDGPVQGLTAGVKQTMDDARLAMAGFAENMEALKHNFLVRGFFKNRGYFDLAAISPADYRKGMLTKSGDRRMLRIWLRADLVFEPDQGNAGRERLTEDGKARLDSAIAPYLEHLASAILVIEGYAQQGARDEQYLTSRARAAIARDYLIGKFHLEPQATGSMALGAESSGNPDPAPWDGVALAVFVPKRLFSALK
jgi:phospholipid/cholesterol/gamma-HCH transport system substrate-binding protein